MAGNAQQTRPQLSLAGLISRIESIPLLDAQRRVSRSLTDWCLEHRSDLLDGVIREEEVDELARRMVRMETSCRADVVVVLRRTLAIMFAPSSGKKVTHG